MMIKCQRCNSNRLFKFSAKCNDMFEGVLLDSDNYYEGYVPKSPLRKYSGNDYVEGTLCLECGQWQGEFPAPDIKVKLMLLKQEDLDRLPLMPEVEIFLMLDSLGYLRWRTVHDYSHGRTEMSGEQVSQLEHDVFTTSKVLLEQLPRFGVNPTSDGNDTPTPEYWTWYRQWKGYINGLSNEEWNILETAIMQQEDISQWTPYEKD